MLSNQSDRRNLSVTVTLCARIRSQHLTVSVADEDMTVTDTSPIIVISGVELTPVLRAGCLRALPGTDENDGDDKRFSSDAERCAFLVDKCRLILVSYNAHCEPNSRAAVDAPLAP